MPTRAGRAVGAPIAGNLLEEGNFHPRRSAAAGTISAHQVYGDIQAVYQGIEFCGHTDQKTLIVTKPYISEKDVEKYAAPTSPTALITLGRGNFAVFHPQDGHQPGVQIGTPGEILKVVIKFRLKI